MSTKVIVIGGGPGGYTCAIRLAQLGAQVTLVEKDSQGGTCLNRGCIPTKAMVRSAEVFHTVSNASSFGVDVTGFSLNFAKVIERKNEIVKKLKDGILSLIKANKIEYINGHASFVDKNTVSVLIQNDSTPKTISADYIVIATGSMPSIPPIDGINLPGIHNSESILNLEKLPQSLTIIGGGIIGMEFASIFQTFGTNVTVIEAFPNILGKVDNDIVKRMVPIFKKRGSEIFTDSAVSSISFSDNCYTTNAEGKSGPFQITSELLLVSTGRKPFVDGLKLEKAGVEIRGVASETTQIPQTTQMSQSTQASQMTQSTQASQMPQTVQIHQSQKTHPAHQHAQSSTEISNIFSPAQPHKNSIPVNNNGQTNIHNIYAIGDVNGGLMLAHVAAHQGTITAEHIIKQNATVSIEHHKDTIIPSCIFTFPEIAYAGKTETELKEQNIPYNASRFMFGANGKALCLGEGEGFVKVLASLEGKIMGVHIMGPHASDLIHEAVIAMEKGITATELSEIVHAHPTLSESLSEAFMGIEGNAIHMMNSRR